MAPAKANIKPVKLGGESTSRSGAYGQTEWKKIKPRVKQASCLELVEPTGRGQSREAGTGLGYSREAGRAFSGNSRSFESVEDSTVAITHTEKLKVIHNMDVKVLLLLLTLLTVKSARGQEEVAFSFLCHENSRHEPGTS